MKPSAKIRPIAEVILEFSFILLYIWGIERVALEWLKAGFFWIFCVGFPILCIATEEREFPELSLDWQQFLKCFRWIFWFTLLGTVSLVSISLVEKSFNYDGNFLMRVSEYFFWAFLQQIGLQTFLTRRLSRAISNPVAAALVSSTLFASIHLPNPALVTFTWIGGFFWCLSFLKSPNLYAIAVSHGWLAVVALYCVPANWLHALRIGPTYWRF